MTKDSLKANKEQLRTYFRKIRAEIPPHRRQEASSRLESLDLKGNILSFASFGTEIDLWLLNLRLAKENRLFLPKVADNKLLICPVNNLSTQLQPSRWGILEPTTSPVESLIDTILVPGLAFDNRGHRLGYGKGHYDRLKIQGRRIGIAFKEQLIDALPAEFHDIALDSIILF